MAILYIGNILLMHTCETLHITLSQSTKN